MGKRSVDYVLKNSTAMFYDKRMIAGECYVKFKVPDDCAFRFFNEQLFTGALLELIDVDTSTIVEAEVLAMSIDTEGVSSTTGSCVLRLHGECTLPDTFVF